MEFWEGSDGRYYGAFAVYHAINAAHIWHTLCRYEDGETRITWVRRDDGTDLLLTRIEFWELPSDVGVEWTHYGPRPVNPEDRDESDESA